MLYSLDENKSEIRNEYARISATEILKQLRFTNPLFLHYYFLINDIKKYCCNIKPNAIIVDFGCGQKPYQEFVTKPNKYIGIDIDKSNHIADIFCSVYNVPLESQYADYAFSFQVIEHLEEPNLMLNEMFRILKPGATLFITFPMSWELHEVPFDYFRFTEFGMRRMLEKIGFQEIIFNKQGSFYSNLGLRLIKLINRKFLRIFVPILNYIFLKLENNSSGDVLNYSVTAKKGR